MGGPSRVLSVVQLPPPGVWSLQTWTGIVEVTSSVVVGCRMGSPCCAFLWCSVKVATMVLIVVPFIVLGAEVVTSPQGHLSREHFGSGLSPQATVRQALKALLRAVSGHVGGAYAAASDTAWITCSCAPWDISPEFHFVLFCFCPPVLDNAHGALHVCTGCWLLLLVLGES